MSKQEEVGHDTENLKPDEDFEWTNSGDKDCKVYNCRPPLVHDHYDVPAHGRKWAKVQHGVQPADYPYKYECPGKFSTKSDPNIKIGNI
jgi:hypothetical protein